MTSGGFVKLRRGIIEHVNRFSGVEFKVFIVLLTLADFRDPHSVSMTLGQLQQIVGASYRSVIRAVNDLTDDGYITYTPATNQWDTSTFSIVKYDDACAKMSQAEEETVFACDTAYAKKSQAMSQAQASDQQKRAPKNLKNLRTKTIVQNAPKQERLDGFDEFWEEQTRKEGKGAARKAYERALKKATPDVILAGWSRSKKAYAAQGRDRSLYPLPATWLNQERWDDDYTEPKEEVEW